MITVPINPMAAHMGGGIIQVYADFPVSGELKHFEVRVAKELAGPYQLFGNRFFKNKDGWLYGFAVGSGTVYMQIRSVGIDGSFSDWVQVKKAILNKPIVIMRLEAIQGSMIAENAMFVTPKVGGRTLAFRTPQEITF